MTTRSVRTQLLLGIAGVVMLTVLLFAAAVWRLILQPAEDDLAARDMHHQATAASSQVRSLIVGVERIVETARQWGRSRQLSIGDYEAFDHLVLPRSVRNRWISCPSSLANSAASISGRFRMRGRTR